MPLKRLKFGGWLWLLYLLLVTACVSLTVIKHSSDVEINDFEEKRLDQDLHLLNKKDSIK